MLELVLTDEQIARLEKRFSSADAPDPEFPQALKTLIGKMLLTPFQAAQAGFSCDQLYAYIKLRDCVEADSDFALPGAAWDVIKNEFQAYRHWNVAVADLVIELKIALEKLNG